MSGEPLATPCIDHSPTPLKRERAIFRKSSELSICSKPLPGRADSLVALPCWVRFEQTTDWEEPEGKTGNVTESSVALEHWRSHEGVIHPTSQAWAHHWCLSVTRRSISASVDPLFLSLWHEPHVMTRNNSLITAPPPPTPSPPLSKRKLSVFKKKYLLQRHNPFS